MRINFARTTLPLSNYDKSAIFVNGYLHIYRFLFFFFFTNFGKCDIISSFFLDVTLILRTRELMTKVGIISLNKI